MHALNNGSSVYNTPPHCHYRDYCTTNAALSRASIRVSVVKSFTIHNLNMRAVQVVRLADPKDALQLTTLPTPTQLSEDQVLINVHAASINFADVLQAQGLYQERPPLPFVPCSECSGTVVAVGKAVASVKRGDKVQPAKHARHRCTVIVAQVVAVTQGGCLAEQVVAHAASIFRVPDNVPLDVAAGMPVAFGTAHLALVHRARIRSGQWVFVLGAAGGVGLAAVQVGHGIWHTWYMTRATGCQGHGLPRGGRRTRRTQGAAVARHARRCGAGQRGACSMWGAS